MTTPAPHVPVRPPRVPKTPPPEITRGPRIERLRDALASTPDAAASHALVEAFWTETAESGTPFVEAIEGDEPHRAVTFLWRDRHRDGRPGTRTVVLLANKLTDPSVWAESQLERLGDTDVWHRTYRVPSDWRATYQLAPDDGEIPAAATAAASGSNEGPRARWAGVATTAVPDPYCRHHFPGKPGDLPTSVVELPGAPPQPYRDRRPGAARGTLTEHAVGSPRLSEPRRVWAYTPPAAGPGPGPGPGPGGHDLLILLDGEDWANRLDIASTLDNLHADGRIPPTVAVMVDAIDHPSRWRDLSPNDTFTDFLARDLTAWAQATLPVGADAAHTTISGRSLGGITALYAGLRAPDRIGAVHVQSASLWWPAEPLPDGRRTGWLRDALVAADRLPTAISIEVGLQEWMLLPPARELSAALRERGDVDVRHSEYQGGHDAFCWRGGLADALVDLAAGRR